MLCYMSPVNRHCGLDLVSLLEKVSQPRRYGNTVASLPLPTLLPPAGKVISVLGAASGA